MDSGKIVRKGGEMRLLIFIHKLFEATHHKRINKFGLRKGWLHLSCSWVTGHTIRVKKSRVVGYIRNLEKELSGQFAISNEEFKKS